MQQRVDDRRASQINGCAFGLDMHSKDARARRPGLMHRRTVTGERIGTAGATYSRLQSVSMCATTPEPSRPIRSLR
jgi:alkylhydroperoxidase family enzyme